jgi:hypothetical protein
MTSNKKTALPADSEIKAYLQRMGNEEFEHFVADLWQRRGWETGVSQKSRDKSLDVMAEKEDPYLRREAIQAKRYKEGNNVGGPKVAEYSSLTETFDADTAVVVTTSDFTRDAQERAQELNVKQVNGDQLASMVAETGAYDLLEKYTEFTRTSSDDGSGEPSATNPGDSEPAQSSEKAGSDGVLQYVYQRSWRFAGYATAVSILSLVIGISSIGPLGQENPINILTASLSLLSGLTAVCLILISFFGTIVDLVGIGPFNRGGHLAAFQESRILKYGVLLLLPFASYPILQDTVTYGAFIFFFWTGVLSDVIGTRAGKKLADGFANGDIRDRSDMRHDFEQQQQSHVLVKFGPYVAAALGLYGLSPPTSVWGALLSGMILGACAYPIGTRLATGLDIDERPDTSRTERAVDGGVAAEVGEPDQNETALQDYVLPMAIGFDEQNLTTADQQHIEIDRGTSTLLVGATRSGKSEAAKVLAYQMIDGWSVTEPLVAYDRKDDWQTFFRSHDIEFEVMSADPADATVTWDLFAEVETERDFRVIANALFTSESDQETGNNKFFEDASRDIFEVICKYTWRTFNQREMTPTNKDLVDYIESRTREEAYQEFSQYDDLRAQAESLDPEASRMAAGVWAHLTQKIRDIFVGTFRSPPEEVERISLREYFAHPNGRALVLSHPFQYDDTIERVYKYLIDDAIRRGMSRDSGSVLILDELPQLPALDKLDELVNVGAGEDVRTLITIQSVGQLRDTYGEDEATGLLAGMSSQVLLRAGDPETVNYYQDIIGQQFERVASKSFEDMTVSEEKRDMFDEKFLTEMRAGECVVNRPDGCIHGRLHTLDNGAREYIDQLPT